MSAGGLCLGDDLVDKTINRARQFVDRQGTFGSSTNSLRSSLHSADARCYFFLSIFTMKCSLFAILQRRTKRLVYLAKQDPVRARQSI